MQFILIKNDFFFEFPRIFGPSNYDVKLYEILEVISIGTASAQRNLLRLKPFIYGNSRVLLRVILTSTSALFFPLR
jgi:hypothetical protein